MSEDWNDETSTAIDVVELRALARQQRSASLTVLTGAATGQVFKLAPGDSVLGRATEAALRLVDDGVSRLHACLTLAGEALTIADLDSRNGTFVNGERLTAPVRLADGDKVQLGRVTVLRFAYQDELDASFHENLVASALRDPLTRLFNKRYLFDRLDSELKFAKRHKTAVSLLMLDIDHFKRVNDTHGHLAGDAVLVALATALARAVRNEDVVARFGGEEFAIILRAIPLEQAGLLAERLRRLIEQTVVPHGDRNLQATVSVGVATCPAAPALSMIERPDQLIEAADRALYASKAAGRNRVTSAPPT